MSVKKTGKDFKFKTPIFSKQKMKILGAHLVNEYRKITFDKNNPIMSTGNPFPRKYSTSYSDSKKSGKMFRQDSAYSRSFAPYLTGDLFRDVSASSKPKENEFSIGWNKEADKIEHLRKQGRILASKSNPLSPQVVMKIMPHITNLFTKILVSGSQDITIRDKK